MSQKNKNAIDEYIKDFPDLFKTALSATADGVVITDTEGSIQWVNPAYETLTGYSIDEVINKNPKILKSGKQNPAYYKELWETILAGNVWKGELWNKRKDGALYLEEQSITPVKDEQSNITHFIAIKRDVTQQHQLQEQLHQAKRIEAIGQLTAGVAHNFNNKLASILGFTELAIEEAQQYSNEEMDDCLSEIIVAGKAARDLVRQMMAFSLNERSELKSGNIDLIVRQAIKLITSSIPSGIRILMDLKDVPPVMLDPVRLHQMLMSLAMNAVKAMSEPGDLLFSTDVIRIDNITCNSCHEIISGDYVSISVKDTGKGILLDDQGKIFMPFFTTHQQDGGTGMGLSALHGMLHDMNGHVIVESVSGQYTIFTLLLPINKASDKVKVDNNNVDFQDKSKEQKHILVVDDEESVADFLSEILGLNGYQVSRETDSKEAFRQLSKNPDKYDLVLTDQDMPQLNGIELAKLLYDIRPGLPVILMTGHQLDKDIGKSEFINATLIKPFETKELLHKIKNFFLM